MASPIFKDMFSIPSPPPPSRDGESKAQHLPVVDISESGIVINALLQFIYPVDDPTLTLELAFDVLLAAEKYEMHRASQWAKVAFETSCLNDDPDESIIRVYSLSCNRQLREQAQVAARGSLRFCLLDPSSIDSLSSAPTRAVLNLMRYHNEVTKRIFGLFSDLSEWPSDVKEIILCSNMAKCASGQIVNPSGRLSVPIWWYNIRLDMTSAARIMSYRPLSMDGISAEQLAGRISVGCSVCKMRLKYKGVDQFHKALKSRMVEVASKVEFEIPWDLPEETSTHNIRITSPNTL